MNFLCVNGKKIINLTDTELKELLALIPNIEDSPFEYLIFEKYFSPCYEDNIIVNKDYIKKRLERWKLNHRVPIKTALERIQERRKFNDLFEQ